MVWLPDHIWMQQKAKGKGKGKGKGWGGGGGGMDVAQVRWNLMGTP